ncbi:MAG: efflux RND transporter periplasmic adaptor subunit [Ignavibacteriales bacterium]|nr:efflux RND transporter periplasmic adaptor subunit [Ignavibacteriales bacterium]
MKKILKYIVFGIVILGVGGLASYRLIVGKTASDNRRQNAQLVRMEKPKREVITYKLTFNGDVLAIRQAGIFSKVSGNLERLYADMGAKVRQNQLLAVIDSTELFQQVQQTSATFSNARMIYQRTMQLFSQSLVSKQDADNAEATMKVSRANYEAAATKLSYARITAPFPGYITRRFLDVGSLVNLNNSVLFTLMDIDSVKIIVNVLEKNIPLVAKIKRAIITFDALPGKEYGGFVANASQAIDLSTRTMAIEVRIMNNDYSIKPGMFASVSLIIDEKPNSLTLPTMAVLHDEAGDYVYVVENNIAKRVRVQIGIEQDSRTEILSGITGSEDIITTGQQFVKEGGSVSVQP